MRSLLFALPGAILLAGCATTRLPPRTMATAASVSHSPVLKAAVDALLPDTLFPPSNAGIKVVSLDRGETLYELNPRMLFNPASNQKMFTSATALAYLGPRYQFNTVVSADTGSRTIVIRGYGDPLLSAADLDSLAGLCVPALTGGPWSVLCDVSYFDDEYWGAGWTWDMEPAAYGAFISPLILDNNTVEVSALPGLLPGDSVLVSIDPPTVAVGLENSAVTVADSVRSRPEISRRWRERSNVVTLQGELLAGGKGKVEHLSVWKPEDVAATVFAEQLRARGVEIAGVRVDTIGPAGTEIARYTHLLDTAATFLNKESDNLSAESLLKTLGAERRGRPGSASAGISVIHEFLSALPYDTNAVTIADGSGLSRYNLTSPEAIIALLRHIYTDPALFAAFIRTLPIAGVDGTLERRMRGTAAEGNVRAKTGTLSGVTALSGYLSTRDDERLAFSILMQNFPGSSRHYRAVQDSICAFFSRYARSSY